MAIDLYEPRTMARMLSEMKPPRTFIRDTFFRNHEEFQTEHVDVDIEIGARRLAPFVSPRLPGKTVDTIGFKTSTYKNPTVAMKKVITGDHLQHRLPGETLYEGRSPAERQAALLGKALADLDGMITRREEWMCAQALFAGQIHVVGDGVDELISFGRPAELSIALPAAAQRWTADTADIPKQLRDWRRACVKACGLAPDTAVLGAKAADALLANEKLRSMLHTLRLDMGQISPEITAMPGVTYLGQLKGTGMDLWSYDEWFVDPDSGEEQPMVPEKQVLIGSSRAYTALRYAAVPVATGSDSSSSLSLVVGARIPDSWIEKEPPARFVKISSRPLPVPTQIGAFLVATVVA